MVRSLLSTTVLGVLLFAAGANAATDKPAATGGTVTIENGVQVIRGTFETRADRTAATESRPPQTINIDLTVNRPTRRGFFAGRL